MLYHGTSAKYLPLIKERGILPRSVSKVKSNWTHTVPSNRNAVYLTDAYGWHFAGAASKDQDKGLILEIDKTRLYDWLLCPDEDVLEQTTRKQEPPEYPSFAYLEWDLKKRTMHYRKIARFNPQLASQSLEAMGTCAYYNEIPWAAVTRYAVIDWKLLHPAIKWQALDSQVSIENYRFLKDRHRALTRWFFGEEVSPEELIGIPRSAQLEADIPIFKEQIKGMTEALASRDGVTVVSEAS
jgi:hypothetical protein